MASLCVTKKPSQKKEKIDLKLRGRWFSAKEKPTFLEKTNGKSKQNQTIKKGHHYCRQIRGTRAKRPRREDKTGTRRRAFRWKVFSSSNARVEYERFVFLRREDDVACDDE